jgi:hypothetical protein
MKWIVLAIAIFAVGYTAVNLYFRKPGNAYRPYQDAQDRATTARLLEAGWHKLPLEHRRPTETAGDNATLAPITRGAVGLGVDFDPHFAEKPQLVASIDRITAPASIAHGQDYTLYFTASLADLKGQLGDLTLYRRENELVLVPSIEKLPDKELLSRRNDSSYSATFSTATLPPGRYTARIVAQGPAATWTFTVW